VTYFVGIDASTTATKALLMDAAGQVAAVASSAYGYDTPRPLWTEQHPDLWWQATIASVRRVLAQAGVGPVEVEAVGLTGQMHGLVLLDAAGEVLRPAILWNDQRTGAECDEIRARLGKARFIQITGSTAPGPAREVYREIYPLYRNLYPALQQSFQGSAHAIR
jgi:xylulokinase